MAAEKEAFEDLYYPLAAGTNHGKFDDFCRGWRAAIENAEALKPSHNSRVMPCLMYAGVNEQCDVFHDNQRCGSVACQLART